MDENERFACKPRSYTFIGVVPFHTNEQKNFNSKLESAIANLEKHVQPNENICPVLLLKLPPSASVSTMQKWGKNFFENNPNTILNAIFFIQPYVSNDITSTSNFIAYYANMATSAHFVKNYKKPLHFVFPVGVMVKVPPLWQLKSGDNKIMLQNQYIYQHGEHYVLPTDVQPRQIGGKITRKGPRVYTNLILDIKNESVGKRHS